MFSETPYFGNPVAVVLGADDLSDEQMRLFARWTNLSETTFLLAPRASGADYRVRIFTTAGELPFAGHPTLGSCHAWLDGGGHPARAGEVVQECGVGLVTVRQTEAGLAFAAPPLLRGGPVEDSVTDHLADLLGLSRVDIVDTQWVDNGPGWVGVLLASADAVLALRPGAVDLDIGVAGPYPEGSPEAIEVRAFTPQVSGPGEDPVTGSLNASLAQWLLATGRIRAPYVARQGTVLGRRGLVRISCDEQGQVWVGGATVSCVSGTVEFGSA